MLCNCMLRAVRKTYPDRLHFFISRTLSGIQVELEPVGRFALRNREESQRHN
jgi:hypothetical protein